MIMFKNKNKAKNIIPVPEENIVAEDVSTVTKENINVVNEEVKVPKKRTNKNKKACRKTCLFSYDLGNIYLIIC